MSHTSHYSIYDLSFDILFTIIPDCKFRIYSQGKYKYNGYEYRRCVMSWLDKTGIKEALITYSNGMISIDYFYDSGQRLLEEVLHKEGIESIYWD